MNIIFEDQSPLDYQELSEAQKLDLFIAFVPTVHKFSKNFGSKTARLRKHILDDTYSTTLVQPDLMSRLPSVGRCLISCMVWHTLA